MSRTGTWNLHLRSQHKQKCPLCDLMKEVNFICPLVSVEESGDLDRCCFKPDKPPNRICSSSSVKLKTYYSASFYLCVSGSLISWFLLVASSSTLWSKNIKFLYGFRFRLDPAKNIPFPERNIPKADHNTSQKIFENEAVAVCTESSSVNDALAIDSPLSFSGNSGSSYACSSEKPSTPLSTKSDSSSEVWDLDKASYWHSLFNLEGEDSQWISDFKSSSPLSTKSDSSTEASDLDRVTFSDSLLSLEEKDEDRGWISDSKTKELKNFYFPSLSCKSDWDPEALSSAADLLETQDMEQVIVDEPIFWPFKEAFHWNSEESWSSFCISPRKNICFTGTPDKSSGSKLLEGKLKPRRGCRRGPVLGKKRGDEAECRSKSRSWAKIAALENEPKPTEVPRIKQISGGKNTTSKKNLVPTIVVPNGRGCFQVDQELPIEALVGLEEFDGHEGLDSEFHGKGMFSLLMNESV